MRRRFNGNGVRGHSMVELLVALLVLGIGVLGVTGLVVVSLQQNRAALLHGEAVQLANDMLDRVRANASGHYDGLSFGDAPPAARDCTANPCSVAELTRFDQAVWKCSLGSHGGAAVCEALRGAGVIEPREERPGLPGGDGAIAVNARVVTIRIRWEDPNDAHATTMTVESQI